ncbi:MAG: hypothetical protein ACI4F4_10380 [Lachnospiraceae bacterium]
MKGVVGKIATVVVAIGILILIYVLLPEYPQSMVKGVVQPIVNATAKTRIENVKNATYKELELNYGAIFENVSGSCWVYQSPEQSVDGAEHVTFYGNDVSVNLSDWEMENGEKGLLYTGAGIKIDFVIRGNNFDVVPYVDDFNTSLLRNDMKYQEQNKKLLQDVLTQIYGGVKKNN